jgi:hypothetical protein
LLDHLDFRRRGLNLLGLEDHDFALFRVIDDGVYYNKYSALRVN